MKPKFLEIDDIVIKYNDLLKVLESLEDTDNTLKTVAINDTNIATILINKGIISKNAKGSYFCVDYVKYSDFVHKLWFLDWSDNSDYNVL